MAHTRWKKALGVLLSLAMLLVLLSAAVLAAEREEVIAFVRQGFGSDTGQELSGAAALVVTAQACSEREKGRLCL